MNSQKEEGGETAEKQRNYMWEEYEMTYNGALKLRDQVDGPSFMKKQILFLKGEIRKLGNVNVNAIEDYKQVSERYEFLKEQHEDLVEAKKR